MESDVVGLARDSRERQQLHALGVDATVEPTDPPAEFVGALRGPTEQASVEWQDPERTSGRVLHERPRRRRSRGDRNQGRPRSERVCRVARRPRRRAMVMRARRARCARRSTRPPARSRSPTGLCFSDSRGQPPEETARWASFSIGGCRDERAGRRPSSAHRNPRRRWRSWHGRESWRGRCAPLPPSSRSSIAMSAFCSSKETTRARRAAFTGRRWSRRTRCSSSSECVRNSYGPDSTSSTRCSPSGSSRSGYAIALNGAGAPGATASTQLDSLLQTQLAERRFALDAWLPWDRRALARAQRTGLPLAGARRRGAYARALVRLLDDLFLPVAPAPRERKLRLMPPRPRDAEQTEEVALT